MKTHRRITRVIAVLLSVCMAFGALPAWSALAAPNEKPDEYTMTFGDFQAVFDGERTVALTGTGALTDDEYYNSLSYCVTYEWGNAEDYRLEIGAGVTEITTDLWCFSEIVLPGTVTRFVPDGLPWEVCIFYLGTEEEWLRLTEDDPLDAGSVYMHFGVTEHEFGDVEIDEWDYADPGIVDGYYYESVACTQCGFELNRRVDQSAIDPVAEIAVEPVLLHEGVDCARRTESVWDDDAGLYVAVSYNKYDINANRLWFIVTLQSGAVLSGSYNDVIEQARDLYGSGQRFNWPSVSTDQGPGENEWGPGEHECTVNWLGMETAFTAVVGENPIASVKVSMDCALNEDLDVARDDGYVDGVLQSYNVYRYDSLVCYEITLKTGEVFRFKRWDGDYRAFLQAVGADDFSPVFEDDQAPGSEWGVGDHTVHAVVCGLPADFTVTVEPGVIKSVTVRQTAAVYETLDLNWSGYAYEDAVVFTVSFTDGTPDISGTRSELRSATGYDFRIEDDQEYEEPWDVGDHTATLVLGRTWPFTVTVSENPVADVKVTQTRPLKEDLDCSGDNEGYDLTDVLRYEITLKNGAVLSGTKSHVTALLYAALGEHEFEIRERSSVSPEAVTAKVSVCGKECTVPLTVERGVVASVTARQTRPLIENEDLKTRRINEYYSYKAYPVEEVTEFTVQFTDGRPALTGTAEELRAQTGYDFYVEDDQSSYETWSAGEHTVSLRLGKAWPFTVTISQECPVESITVSDVKTLDAKTDGFCAVLAWNDYRWAYKEGAVRFTFTVRMKDGAEKTYNYYHCGVYDNYPVVTGQWHDSEYERYDDCFIFGKNHVLECSYMGFPFEVTIPAVNEGSFDYVVQNGEAYITDYYGETEELAIPAEIGGLPVAGVADLSLRNEWDLHYVKKLVIPDGVRTFSAAAASRLSGLLEFTAGKDVAGLSSKHFAACIDLTSASVSAENPNFASLNGVIYDKGLTELIVFPAAKTPDYSLLPETVTELGDYFNLFAEMVEVGESNAFYTTVDGILYKKDMTELVRCSRDKTGAVEIPATVTKIDASAFYGCTGLTEIKVPYGVTEIVYSTFGRCGAEKIELPVTVRTVGDYAFCESDVSEIELPPLLRGIGRRAFSGCSGLTAVSLPDGLLDLGENAFYECTALSSVTFGGCLSVISDSAFARCTALTEVTIPKTVDTVESWAFAYSGLKKVEIKNGGAAVATTAFEGCPIEVARIGGHDLDLSAPADPMEARGLKKISYTSAYYDPATREIIYPDSVTEIVYLEFTDVYSLPAGLHIESLPTSVVSIEKNTFRRVMRTDEEDGAYYIGDALLEDSPEQYARAVISVREGTRIIANDSFYGDRAASAVLPEGLEIIGRGAFYGTRLTEITLPESLTALGEYAFGRTRLTAVHIPAALTSIGDFAFADTEIAAFTVDPENPAFTAVDGVLYTKDLTELVCCPSAKTGELHIPATVAVIRPGAFVGCHALTAVYIPESVQSMALFEREYVAYLVDSWGGEHFYADMYFPSEGAYPTAYVVKGSRAEAYVTDACLQYDLFVPGDPACAHTERVSFEDLPATCVSAGHTAYTQCTACGATFGRGTYALDPAAHVWNSGRVTKAATMFASGELTRTCVLCGVTETEEIPALDADTVMVNGDETGVYVVCAADAVDGDFILLTEENPDLAQSADLPGNDLVTAYDIMLVKDGEAVQPEKPVTVYIPLPFGFDIDSMALYHIKNGKAERVNFRVEGGFIVFEASSFSIYVLASANTAGITGDVDGSGEITPGDARLALRISLGLMKDGDVVMTEEMQARADVDGKDGVQPADARLILRKSLGLVDEEWVD